MFRCERKHPPSFNSSPRYEEKIVLKIDQDDGIKKTVYQSFMIGGKDTFHYVHIFDKKGNLVKEYGFGPIDEKYKVVRSFNDTLLEKEIEYLYNDNANKFRNVISYVEPENLNSFPEEDSLIFIIKQYKYFDDLSLKQELIISPEMKEQREADEVEIRNITNYNQSGKIISQYVIFVPDTTNWEILKYKDEILIEHIQFEPGSDTIFHLRAER